MTRPVCCSTPTAWCAWCAVFLVVYGASLAAVAVWPGIEPFDQALLLAALGLACVASFVLDRTYHCAITGPLFLLGALAVGAGEAGFVRVDSGFVWGVVLLGVGVAVLLEGRFAAANRVEPTV